MTVRGTVFSDLHMFSPVSDYRKYLPTIRERVLQSEICVLNGDIIDFRRSELHSTASTTTEAVKWLTDLLASAPNCHFYYLLGNHDSVAPYRQALRDISLPNFHLTPYILRLGGAVFLHGDVCNENTTHEELVGRREGYGEVEYDPLSSIIARLIVMLRLHFTAYIAHNKESLAKRLLHYISSVDGMNSQAITDVFFGHTHAAFTDFQFEGVRFHNTGAAIRGLKFLMLPFSVEKAELLDRQNQAL